MALALPTTIDTKIDSDIQAILARCTVDLEFFCKTIMPKTFFRPFSDGHRAICRIFDDPTITQAVIIAPRGVGKTCLVRAAILRDLLFASCRHLILAGASYEKGARPQSENIKIELETNPAILEYWGSLKSDKWAEDEWITSLDQRVLPIGAGQKVRGQNYKGIRPDRIVGDDIEDLDNTSTEDNRKKVRDWWFDTILKLRDLGSHDYKAILIGSLLHEKSLLAILTERDPITNEYLVPGWHPVVLELHDDNGHSYWPEYMSDADIARELAQARAAGTLDGWMREMRGIPVAQESRLFAQSQFLTYDLATVNADPTIQNFLIVDPARTVSLSSDPTAMVVLGHSYDKGLLYYRDAINERLHPQEITERAVHLCRTYNISVLAIETHGLHEHITHQLIDYIIQHGGGIQVIELTPRGGSKPNARADLSGKNLRIAAMAPIVNRGQILFNPACVQPIELQARAFPRGKHDDLLDCLAYQPQLFQRLGRLYLGGAGTLIPTQDEYTFEAADRLACLRENAELQESLGTID